MFYGVQVPDDANWHHVVAVVAAAPVEYDRLGEGGVTVYVDGGKA